ACRRVGQRERELVARRGSLAPSVTKLEGPSAPVPAPAPTSAAGPAQMMGRAKVMPRPQREPTGVIVDPVEPRRKSYQPLRGERARALKIGWEFTGAGAFIAVICWGLWAGHSKGAVTGPGV